MTFGEQWEAFNTHPMFREKSYEDQARMRDIFLQDSLAQTPSFMALNPTQQQQVYQQFLSSAPTFIEEPTPQTQRYIDIAERLKRGDEGAAREAAVQLGFQQFSEQNGLFARLAELGARLVGDDDLTASVDAITDRSSDEYKAVEYLRSVAYSPEYGSGWAKAASTIGAIGGVAAGIAQGRVALTAPLNWARNASVAYAGALGQGGKTPFTTWLFSSAIPNASESVADGLGLMAGHIAAGNPQGDLPEWATPASPAGQVALGFGYEVVQDMLIWTGLNLLGSQVKNAFRAFSKKGFTGQAAQQVYDEDTFQTLFRQAVMGEDLSKAQVQTLDPDLVRRFRQTKATWERASRLGELSTDEANQFLASAKANLNLVKTPSGWQLRNPVSDAVEFGNYATSSNAINDYVRRTLNPPERAYKALDSAMQNQFEITRVVRTSADPELVRKLNLDTVSKSFTPDAAGRLSRENLEIAARSLVDDTTARKLDIVQVDTTLYNKLDDVSRVQKAGDRIKLFVPDRVTSLSGLKRVIRQVGGDLSTFVDDASTFGKAVKYITDVQTKIPSSVNKNLIATMSEAAGLPTELTQQGLRIGERVFTNMDEALEEIGLSYALRESGSVTKTFGEQFGITIKETDGRWVARKSGNILEYGDSAEELGRKLVDHGFVPRIDMERGPQVIRDATTDELVFQAGTVRGPSKYLRDFAEQYFKRTNPVQVLQKYTDGSVARDKLTTAFQVRSPEWGIIAEFDSFKRAQAFVKGSVDTLDNLRDKAFFKGILDVRTAGGKFLARGLDGEVKTFDTLADLRNHIKNTPQPPTWTKEISNLNETEIDSIWDQFDADELKKVRAEGAGQPVDWSPVTGYIKDRRITPTKLREIAEEFGTDSAKYKNFSIRYNFAKLRTRAGRLLTDPTYTTMRKYASETDLDFIVTGVFEPMDKEIKNARGLLTRFVDLIDGVAGVGTDGRRAPTEMRQKALAFLEMDESKWASYAAANKIAFDGPMRTYVNRFRQATRAFAKTFDIDDYKLLTNYLPHLREFMMSKAGRALADKYTFASDVMREIWQGNVPKEMRFFAEYMRVDELVEFAKQTDPQELLARYVTKGIKNLTLGNTYTKLVKTVNDMAASGALPRHLVGDIASYLEDVMGMFSDASSKAAEASAQAMSDTFSGIMNKFRKAENQLPPKVSRDLISTLHGLTIASTMSFRPWLPIRNMQQIWTTLAGHFGNARVIRALKRMDNLEDVHKRAKRLRSSGRLRESAPIFGLTNTVMLEDFNRKGMKPYTGSDQYTRLIVDSVVEDAFKPAATKYARGIINEKQFLNLSELNRFDPIDQRRVVELLQTKGYERAFDYYGDIIDRESMFSYTAGSNPASWRGWFGRLFGIFGHYPVYYARNLLNGLSRGSAFQRLQFAGRVAFNTAALWYTFEKTLGIRADAFIPWKTMFFSGGPYYNLMNDALATASGDPGAKDWSAIRRDLTRLFVPLGLAANRGLQGLRLLEEGRTYEGMVAMMSAPLIEGE